MITTREELVPEYFAASSSITMHRDIIVIEDDEELGRLRVHSKAFLPGEIEELKQHIGSNVAPVVAFCEAAWTPEVVAKQEAINRANSEDSSAVRL